MTRFVIALGMLFMTHLLQTRAEGEGDVIRQRQEPASKNLGQSILDSDVVDMEFRVKDLSNQETTFSSKGVVRPSYNQRVETRARSKWGDRFVWETGLDLSVHRATHWDAGARETTRESMQPQYHQRLALVPWDQSEISFMQTASMEPDRQKAPSNELWRSTLAYRQQLGRLTELRLEAAHEEKTTDALQLPVHTETLGGVISQQLGTPDLKLRLGLRNATQTRPDLVMDENTEKFRREAGLDWKALPQVGFYGGAVLEDESRSQALSEESLLLYEFRSRWVPVPILQMTGGLTLNSREKDSGAESDQTQWFLRGELQPSAELSLFTQVRWDQSERRESISAEPYLEEKIFIGAGPKLKLDETTRISAEYGLARDVVKGSGQESLVEHMLSFVLSTDF
jgi:hypothetical protein